MAIEKFDPNDDDALDRMREMFGPQQIDQQVRQAVTMCWMSMPREKRTVDQVEAEVRRIVDRALRDLREDSDRFGLGG